MQNSIKTESLKVVINYFDKTALVSSAQEAKAFINTLNYRGNSHALVCNDKTEELLKDIFNGRVLPKFGRPFQEYYDIRTTGCGDSQINLYLALADTLENHNIIVVERQRIKDEEEKIRRREN